jgi:hypothetical protein
MPRPWAILWIGLFSVLAVFSSLRVAYWITHDYGRYGELLRPVGDEWGFVLFYAPLALAAGFAWIAHRRVGSRDRG